MQPIKHKPDDEKGILKNMLYIGAGFLAIAAVIALVFKMQ